MRQYIAHGYFTAQLEKLRSIRDNECRKLAAEVLSASSRKVKARRIYDVLFRKWDKCHGVESPEDFESFLRDYANGDLYCHMVVKRVSKCCIVQIRNLTFRLRRKTYYRSATKASKS